MSNPIQWGLSALAWLLVTALALIGGSMLAFPVAALCWGWPWWSWLLWALSVALVAWLALHRGACARRYRPSTSPISLRASMRKEAFEACAGVRVGPGCRCDNSPGFVECGKDWGMGSNSIGLGEAMTNDELRRRTALAIRSLANAINEIAGIRPGSGVSIIAVRDALEQAEAIWPEGEEDDQ